MKVLLASELIYWEVRH